MSDAPASSANTQNDPKDLAREALHALVAEAISEAQDGNQGFEYYHRPRPPYHDPLFDARFTRPQVFR